MTSDLDAILFIGRRVLLSSCGLGRFFSQCAALRCKLQMRGFPQSKSLSLHRTDWTPSLALFHPPSALFITLPHCDQQLTFLLPFHCVSLFTHLKYQGLLLKKKRKHHTIHHVHTHTRSDISTALVGNSCFLIKSKQPLAEFLPCYLTPATHLINRWPHDAQVISFVQRVEGVKSLPHMSKSWLHSKHNTTKLQVHHTLAPAHIVALKYVRLF